MNSTHAVDFASLVEGFFCKRLMNQQNVSPRTVEAYRDTFRILMSFIEDTCHCRSCDFSVEKLNADLVLDFLNSLEIDRGNCVRTRNARLAAIRSFAQYAAAEDPSLVALCRRILSIPMKRFDRPSLSFLSREEIKVLLDAPDTETWSGRRDVAMFTTLYNTGARVSELTGITMSDLHLDNSASVTLHGKGRKERTIPLWKTTARLLKNWMKELADEPTAFLFPERKGNRLSRSGVEYRLRCCVQKAAASIPSLANRSITPHVFRHTAAMHLLESGVDISVIALWLGHESMETTHMYLEADMKMKERAMNLLQPPNAKPMRFKANDRLRQFLDSL